MLLAGPGCQDSPASPKFQAGRAATADDSMVAGGQKEGMEIDVNRRWWRCRLWDGQDVRIIETCVFKSIPLSFEYLISQHGLLSPGFDAATSAVHGARYTGESWEACPSRPDQSFNGRPSPIVYVSFRTDAAEKGCTDKLGGFPNFSRAWH